MPLKGDVGKISDIKRAISNMPRTIAADVAGRAAPAMTDLTRQAFTAGKTVYGDARPNGADGQPLRLKASGATERDLSFTVNGTIVRAKLGPQNRRGVEYGKFLIGKYGVLPNGFLPVAWAARLRALVAAFSPEK